VEGAWQETKTERVEPRETNCTSLKQASQFWHSAGTTNFEQTWESYSERRDGGATTMDSIFLSVAFLLANVVSLGLILFFNRQRGTKSQKSRTPAVSASEKRVLAASDILGWEFEYARTTASEAMQDRHTMINYYLLVVAVVASGVTAVVTQKDLEVGVSWTVGTLLLWVLCGVGWFYFLKIIRLRQAWHDSARAMNQIKEFFFQYATEFDAEELRKAFRWQGHTMPSPGQPWTVFFYSAMLIGFLDAVAFVVGGFLIDSKASLTYFNVGALTVLGLLFFALHVYLYFAFLEQKPSTV